MSKEKDTVQKNVPKEPLRSAPKDKEHLSKNKEALNKELLERWGFKKK